MPFLISPFISSLLCLTFSLFNPFGVFRVLIFLKTKILLKTLHIAKKGDLIFFLRPLFQGKKKDVFFKTKSKNWSFLETFRTINFIKKENWTWKKDDERTIFEIFRKPKEIQRNRKGCLCSAKEQEWKKQNGKRNKRRRKLEVLQGWKKKMM